MIYAELKTKALVARKSRDSRDAFGADIAKYAVSVMQRIGFTNATLCAFIGLPGWDLHREESNAILMKRFGALAQLAAEIDKLTRLANLPKDVSRGFNVQVRSPRVRAEMKKIIAAMVADEHVRLKPPCWTGRNIILRIKLTTGIESERLREVRRAIEEGLREFRVICEVVPPSEWAGITAKEVLPSGQEVELPKTEWEILLTRALLVVNRAQAKAELPRFYDRERHEPARARVPLGVKLGASDPSAQNDKAAPFGPDFV